MDSVHKSMVETLLIPVDNKNIMLHNYELDCFDSKYPYEYFIGAIMFSCRTNIICIYAFCSPVAIRMSCVVILAKYLKSLKQVT